MREEAEAGLQALVENLQEDLSRSKASLADCQDMLSEMQSFAEERVNELADVKAELEVRPFTLCCGTAIDVLSAAAFLFVSTSCFQTMEFF
jgi:hypothetical protein